MEVKEGIEIIEKVQELDEAAIQITYDPLTLGKALDYCFAYGRISLAEETIDKVINVYPLEGIILRVKALLLAKRNRSQDAIYLLSLVPHTDNYFLSCVELIGVIFMNNQQFQKGIETFSVLLTQALDPEIKGFVLHQRGICYQYLEQHVEAFMDFKEACLHFYHREAFFKEALVSFKWSVNEGKFWKIKNETQEFVESLKQIVSEYYTYGAYIFSAEWFYFNGDLAQVEWLLEEFRASEYTDQITEFEARFEEMKQFLALYKPYAAVKKQLAKFHKPSGPLSGRTPREGVKGMARWEAEMDEYLKNTQKIREELLMYKAPLVEMNEEEFELFDAMNLIQGDSTPQP